MAQAPEEVAPEAPAPEVEQIARPDDRTISSVAANARASTRRLSGPVTAQEDATPDEQEEYQRATELLSRVMYEDVNTSTAIIDSLHPENKVGSVAQTALLLVRQIDEKADLDEAVIPQLTMDIVDRLIDLGEQTKQMTFTDQEAQGALGAAWEGVMQHFGAGDAADFEEATQGLSDDDLKSQVSSYKGFLGSDF